MTTADIGDQRDGYEERAEGPEDIAVAGLQGAAEATATRAADTAGHSITGFASLTGGYALTETMLVVGRIAIEDLGDLTDSALVADRMQRSLSVGLVFEF